METRRGLSVSMWQSENGVAFFDDSIGKHFGGWVSAKRVFGHDDVLRFCFSVNADNDKENGST